MKISNSGEPGFTSSPNTQAFKESASKLKGTPSDVILGCAFNICPVEAEPVNVTTSSDSTKSKIPFAEPVINCKAPSGKIVDSMMARTTVSVKKEVIVAGLTIAGTPAKKLTAIFSNIPQTGKLNALI